MRMSNYVFPRALGDILFTHGISSGNGDSSTVHNDFEIGPFFFFDSEKRFIVYMRSGLFLCSGTGQSKGRLRVSCSVRTVLRLCDVVSAFAV